MNGKSEADWKEMLRHRINSSCLAQQWFEVKFFAACFTYCHGFIEEIVDALTTLLHNIHIPIIITKYAN